MKEFRHGLPVSNAKGARSIRAPFEAGNFKPVIDSEFAFTEEKYAPRFITFVILPTKKR